MAKAHGERKPTGCSRNGGRGREGAHSEGEEEAEGGRRQGERAAVEGGSGGGGWVDGADGEVDGGPGAEVPHLVAHDVHRGVLVPVRPRGPNGGTVSVCNGSFEHRGQTVAIGIGFLPFSLLAPDTSCRMLLLWPWRFS